MFNVSFGELLVVVTAAGLLLGKKEIKAGSRFLGTGLGRLVGLLQGVRLRYEEKSQGTQLYELHRSVKRGLDEVGTIGTDLQSISSGRISHRPAAPAYASASTSLSAVAAVPTIAHAANNNAAEIAHLTRLILAEDRMASVNANPKPTTQTQRQLPVDIIALGVKESILADTYAKMLPPNSPPTSTK